MKKPPISLGPRIFRVLTTDQLSDADKVAIRAQLATFKSAWDAHENHLAKGFAKVSLSPTGRVYSLQYKGIEVALLVRRHASEIELTHMETAPAVVLKSSEDDWIVVDLMDASDALVGHALTYALSSAKVEIEQLRATLVHFEGVSQSRADLINKLENTLQDAKDLKAKVAARKAKAAAKAAAPPPPVKKKKAATKKAPAKKGKKKA